MSNYSLQVTWSTKDALASGQTKKAISATELGNEFSAIAVASATKYDSDDLASEVEAETLTAPDKLITPLNLDQVFKDNDGILSDIQAITGTAADGLLAWDQTDTTVKMFTAGTGLAFSGTTIATTGPVADIAGLAVTDSNFIVGDGANFVLENASTARTSMGVAIGTNVQAWDTHLDSIAALAKTNSAIIVGNGTTWVLESGATMRTSLGLGTGDSPQFTSPYASTSIELGHATDTTLTREAAGHLAVQGQTVAAHGAGQINANYSSADIFMSTSSATGGAAGDIWFEYTA